MSPLKSTALGMKKLTIDQLVTTVRNKIPVSLSQMAVYNIERSYKRILKFLGSDQIIYGLMTGLGGLSSVRIPPDKIKTLQLNLIRSHCCGMGDPFPEEVVRTIMILLVQGLGKGHSGCRKVVVETLIKMVNKGIIPIVPSQGSLGASGDLIPLAHIAIVMIGEGEAVYKGKRYSGAAAMRKAGIPVLTLINREGVSLVNGTYGMSALGALTQKRADELCKLADIAAAMTLEVVLGSSTAVKDEIHRLKPHPGQIATASNIKRLVKDSEIIASHKFCDRVQDAYSLRCSPQVHGAVKDALRYSRSVMEIEINSVTDNPIVFDDGVISGGNFHGQPLAISLDTLGIAIVDLGNISERRIDRLMNPVLSELPAFLSPDAGLNSGYMMAHYLAASISFENRGLATPGSIDSVPVSANKEDYNSNGMWSARKAWKIVENAERIIAVELVCAAQAVDFRSEYKPGKGTQAAYQVIRSKVKMLKQDRIIGKDIQSVIGLIRSGDLVQAVEKSVGKLSL